jgi:DNA-binding response OmpR family regulator
MPNVAIIEDVESMSNRLRDLVSSLPNVVARQAFNREQAIALIEEDHFDVVIVDIELGPGLSEKYAGFEVLKLLHGRPTVTLVVSGTSQEILHDVSLSLHAYDFIGKPFNDRIFLNKFEHALAASRDINADNTDNASDPQTIMPANLTRDSKKRFGFRWKGQPVKLTVTQARLVDCLIGQPGQIVKKEALTAQMAYSNAASAIATHLSEARNRFKLVDSTFDQIESEPGVGYYWKTDP